MMVYNLNYKNKNNKLARLKANLFDKIQKIIFIVLIDLLLELNFYMVEKTDRALFLKMLGLLFLLTNDNIKKKVLVIFQVRLFLF